MAKKEQIAFISDPDQSMPHKRLFIGMLCFVSVLFCLLLFVGWLIPFVPLGPVSVIVPYLLGACFSFLILTVLWSLFVVNAQILWGKSFWGASFARKLTIKLFLPCMEFLARLVGLSVEELRRSFIKINNHLVLQAYKEALSPKRVLLLLPHCIQKTSCTLRLSVSTDNCAQCGACSIAVLQEIKKKYDIVLSIAVGGTIARKIIKTVKPQFVIAIACERDLAAGIQDVYPLPVFGILNHRPEGPCVNTQLNVQLVEQVLLSLLPLKKDS